MSTELGEVQLWRHDAAADVVLQPEPPVRRARGRELAAAFSAAIMLAAGCSSDGGTVDAHPLPSQSASTEASPPTSPSATVEASPTPTTQPTATPTSRRTGEPARRGTYKAVYFQPYATHLPNPHEELPGVYKMVAEPNDPHGHEQWTGAERCDGRNANKFLEQSGIDTVLTFSLGRLGLPYALDNMTPAQQRQIEYAIVVDPGNMKDLTGPCDLDHTSTLISLWLNRDKDNRLVIVAGERTAQDDFQSIYARYASGIAGTDLENQVTICANKTLGHHETWDASKHLVNQPRITKPEECPPGFQGLRPQR